ncbi:arginine--tRNA ligase [Fusobacterium necrophorum subsp. funduliforme ATCC 51357]|uniref:Arginine--tRNA ligase n=2 Tax=Fusobacterium necrophorum TaxID=859 RepID=A0A162IVV5_9FUSO|nr:arginine--tRNA ligase [Fusobacterium necrophorum]AYV92662.1 arginine--tRNA ligase [Fusobacterium necrophorum subsp. funduliforme]EIJ72325.1 arginine--tRNA ligase [Fusobacterium necrophorum subsp. funduliforme ATCC 51357]KAB0553782.1 arginine--tRNA ligase [Fusobacterium necrophorum subsp. funduliforme]KYL04557.1 arginine--tRNA ligase [Fusobacterium necrophorum subsp. funduliforme]KYM41114.1 arginine--tRNA ligase [Fusobacterium necrophorum subsp. funduliforme]
MLLVNKELSKILTSTVEKLYADKEMKEVEIAPATNEKFGDFQCNFAMMNSKIIGKNPRMIAEEIQKNLVENEVIEKLEIAGPGFINIFLKEAYLSTFIKKIGKEKFDFSFLNRKGDVVIDFSSPNIAKRMHIGHLRSTIIGDSICRIYRYLGYHVIGDNHIGDWGTQFGKLIIGYRKWLDQDAYKKNAIEELERVYVKFSQESEEHPELEEEARLELKKLQDGDEENYNLWKEFIQVSMEEYEKLYSRLDIHFDTFYGESFYHPIMPEVVKELVERGIAKEDDGAKVVFFPEEENLFPCIVQKKDGAFLYATSDIATVKFRLHTYDVNRLIYLTDERQQDHFKQFFRITEMLGWNVEKYHVWFGIMRFADGVFSTRKGNVIRLEELLDEGKRRAYEIVQEKNPSLPEEEKQHIAEVVGVGAIKYADLSQNRQSPIIFEWDKILSFEGNTAPYLQYSYARVQSILDKAKNLGKEATEDVVLVLQDKYERSLANYMTIFPSSVLKAAETCKPNLIADYLYDLSKKLNSFYNNCPILNQEEEILKSRAYLAKQAGEVIKQGLNLLGIQTLDRM